jgi:hypothetical protein
MMVSPFSRTTRTRSTYWVTTLTVASAWCVAAEGYDALGMPRPGVNKNGIGQFEANLDQIIANAEGAPAATSDSELEAAVTYSRKNGRKYHYYVSKSESRFGAPGKSYERLPAPEIEAAVVAQIRTVLTSPESIASVVRHIQRNGAQIDEATTVMAMGRLNDVWDQMRVLAPPG